MACPSSPCGVLPRVSFEGRMRLRASMGSSQQGATSQGPLPAEARGSPERTVAPRHSEAPPTRKLPLEEDGGPCGVSG